MFRRACCFNGYSPPFKDLDQQMIEWAVSADLPVMLLLTKADKLSQSARNKQVKMVREAILLFKGDIQVRSLFCTK